jgi:hypothetical protein
MRTQQQRWSITFAPKVVSLRGMLWSPMACKADRTMLSTGALSIVFRFRFVVVGKNLKPVKPYVITNKRLELKKGSPVLVSG